MTSSRELSAAPALPATPCLWTPSLDVQHCLSLLDWFLFICLPPKWWYLLGTHLWLFTSFFFLGPLLTPTINMLMISKSTSTCLLMPVSSQSHYFDSLLTGSGVEWLKAWTLEPECLLCGLAEVTYALPAHSSPISKIGEGKQWQCLLHRIIVQIKELIYVKFLE